MFINVSSEPSMKWSEEQRNAALAMGRCVSILDIRVPEIAPEADEESVEIIAEDLAYHSTGYFAPLDTPYVILLQCEHSLFWETAKKIRRIAPLSTLVVPTMATRFEDIGEGLRMARDVFVRFRKIE